MAFAVAFFLSVAAVIGILILAQKSLSQRGLIILGASLGGLIVLVLAAILLLVEFGSKPHPIEAYADAELQQSEQDALFALGQPSAKMETDQGTIYRFDRKWYRQYVTVDDTGVSRSYVERTGNYFPAPRIFGVNGDQNFDQVVDILGAPSSTVVDDQGVGRILTFGDYNIFIVFSTRDRMEAIGVFSGTPVEFAELNAVAP